MELENLAKEDLEIELLKQQIKFYTVLNRKIEKSEGIPISITDTIMDHYSGYLGSQGYEFKKGK